MQKYWITNNIWVDHDTEKELVTNGEYGDAKVRLVSAEGKDNRHYFYLQTNGDPVPLLDSDPEHNRDWVETLGIVADEVIAIIETDGESEDHTWACDQLRDLVDIDET